MATVEMLMPKMGESIMEGTILKWLKKVGEKIDQDESVLEVATDKVDTEVPAIYAGILKEILAQEGDVVQVGKPIAIISTEKEETAPVSQPENGQETDTEITKTAATIENEVQVLSGNGANKLPQPATGRFYSPLVLTIAREEGIPMPELEYVPGSGTDSRVTKKDILHYVANRQKSGIMGMVTETIVAPTETTPEKPPREVAPDKQNSNGSGSHQPQVNIAVSPEQTPVSSGVSQPATSYSGQADIIEMDRMRKLIAQRMVDSKRISPHVTSFVEADVTSIVFWRNRVKNEFKAKEGDTITYTPVFIEAVAKAIKDYPMINVSVDGDKIIVKKDIHIGMAVALPSGNLIVPVIKHADQLNIVGLTKKVNDLARRARENKLTADDLSGGTFTTSNVGSFGNVMGTPIIMQPQVAIMAFGAIQKKPAVIETPYGDTIGVRHFMFLSHSYDHRVVDGALGGMFVRRVADYLEAFDVNRKVF